MPQTVAPLLTAAPLLAAAPLHKTCDFVRDFPSYHPHSPVTCRIRIYQREGAVPVIIASQCKGSVASVTNFAEQIAQAVLDTHGSALRLNSQEPKPPFLWLEHYPPGVLPDPCPNLSPFVRSALPDEKFHLVTFTSSGSGVLTSPKWWPVNRRYVEETLLRAPLRG